MKNILKKLLLLFVIGMLGQTYIDNTCWASKSLGKYGFVFHKKLKAEDWQNLECPFNDPENFNPNNFFSDKDYIPDPKTTGHASRGGISFVKEITVDIFALI